MKIGDVITFDGTYTRAVVDTDILHGEPVMKVQPILPKTVIVTMCPSVYTIDVKKESLWIIQKGWSIVDEINTTNT